MADVSTLILRLKNSQYLKGMKQTNMATGRLTQSTISLGKVVGAIGGVFAAKKLFDFGTAATKAAIDAEEVANKFNVVFETIQGSANKTANSLAKDFGLAGSTARKLLGDTGDLLTGFGFTEKEALEMSNTVQRLAGDLASFSNIQGGTSAASERITKALLGETESLSLLGVKIIQGSDGFKNLVKSIKETTGATATQAKSLAILQQIQEQSTKAAGDNARTFNSSANVIRRTSEAWKEFKESLGTVILDLIDIPNTGNWVIDVLNKMTKFFKENGSEIVFTIKTLVIEFKFAGKQIINIFKIMYDNIKITIENAVMLFDFLKKSWEERHGKMGDVAWATLRSIARGYRETFTKIIEFVRNPSLEAAEAIKNAFDGTKIGSSFIEGLSEGLSIDAPKLKAIKSASEVLDGIQKINAERQKALDELYKKSLEKRLAGAKKEFEATKDITDSIKDASPEGKLGGAFEERVSLAGAALQGSVEALRTIFGSRRGPQQMTADNTKRTAIAVEKLYTLNQRNQLEPSTIGSGAFA